MHQVSAAEQNSGYIVTVECSALQSYEGDWVAQLSVNCLLICIVYVPFDLAVLMEV